MSKNQNNQPREEGITKDDSQLLIVQNSSINTKQKKKKINSKIIHTSCLSWFSLSGNTCQSSGDTILLDWNKFCVCVGMYWSLIDWMGTSASFWIGPKKGNWQTHSRKVAWGYEGTFQNEITGEKYEVNELLGCWKLVTDLFSEISSELFKVK